MLLWQFIKRHGHDETIIIGRVFGKWCMGWYRLLNDMVIMEGP